MPGHRRIAQPLRTVLNADGRRDPQPDYTLKQVVRSFENRRRFLQIPGHTDLIIDGLSQRIQFSKLPFRQSALVNEFQLSPLDQTVA